MELRLDSLVGRRVFTANHRVLGRLEEFRAEERDDAWVITEYVVGPAGLAERLGLGARRVLGVGQKRGFLIRWDQLDLSKPEHPHLVCPIAELRPL